MSRMQASAVVATLSPQNDWYQNVSAGERIVDIITSMGGHRWSPEMEAVSQEIGKSAMDAKFFEMARGKTLDELVDTPEAAARWIRTFDQAHNNRSYNAVTPEGGTIGPVTTISGEPGTMAWKSYDRIIAAMSILKDGSAENIHYQLGKFPKVRSFYNNIFDPDSDLGFTTIDTHATAAALMRPLSGADLEVTQNFGGVGSASSAESGNVGMYPIIQEAYRRAALEMGVQPREMQSITWEAVRGLFESAKKSGMKNEADAIWTA